ncbi:hypothetical protein EWM64_g4510 [Hericium alpestre]|uniref:Glucose-methanol-choline oxidoreductase N-terminal domain-containing protein n=1 Tax=Hericium alpestre TaxID=135208 RepID=A0A4Y9ZXH0_9AGAM|nr:hypothetical protein EWM64_g4510 [Hericium alpestre]
MIVSADAFSKQKFDYVVVGGGTAGCVVAARLSEDPNVVVGLIEAGEYISDMPQINIPGMAGSVVMNEHVDWRFKTVPQTAVDNRVIGQPRGKVLGGSSALNLLIVGRATAAEYDAGTVDPATVTRSYSASAYFAPNADRKNLILVTGAQATRVLFNSDGQLAVANGVEYMVEDVKYIASVSKEVVLSAGSFQSPQLLELSGIGKKSLLEQFGIKTVDHVYVPSAFEVKPEWDTSDLFKDPILGAKELDLYHSKREGQYSSAHSAYAFLPLHTFNDKDTVETLQEQIATNTTYISSEGLKKQFELVKSWFTDPSQLQLEIVQNAQLTAAMGIPEAGKKYQTFLAGIVHPLSRGSVHIASADPLAAPAIDPAYLKHSLDLAVLVQATRFVWKLADTEPLKSTCVGMRVAPFWHPVGSVAMLPREDGGVVDNKLVVYGTKNLRVIDGSVIPLQISCHTQMTIYALAEKAADLIKAAN